ncbi:MAG: hypothetical protein ACJ748_11415 [Flavisolibacter sp.]
MALKVSINYEGENIIYDVESTQEEVYIFRMCNYDSVQNRGSIPQKLVIRRKGKIWISDAENYQALVNSLTEEVKAFNSNNGL